MLGIVPNKPLDESPIPIGDEFMLDWDPRLSIEFMRSHAKIEDVPAVMDDQLRLYRSAAMEAAEKYTGLLLARQRNVEETAEKPYRVRYAPESTYSRVRPDYNYYTHRLQYPSSDGYVYLYGGSHPNDNKTIRIQPNTRKVRIPIQEFSIDMSNCCDPCANQSSMYNGGMMLSYRAGYKSSLEVPTTVVLGMLQFITWCIEHPGDELLTQRNRIETRAGLAGLQGSNNIAMISGAIETWRMSDDEAV